MCMPAYSYAVHAPCVDDVRLFTVLMLVMSRFTQVRLGIEVALDVAWGMITITVACSALQAGARVAPVCRMFHVT